MFNNTLRGGFGLPRLGGLPRPPFVPGMRQTATGDEEAGEAGPDNEQAELPPVSANTPMSYAPPMTAQTELADGTPVPSSALPAPPPAINRRKELSPWSKANSGQTLLDIGAAFLSNPDFFRGLGAAGQALSGRMDELRARAVKQTAYGGPGGQFEITTNPDGTRAIREVPEFAAYNKAVREAKATKPAEPKDVVDINSRVARTVMQFPPEQRPYAYADIRAYPQKYGIDASHLPYSWTEDWGKAMSGMGITNQQAAAGDRQDRAFNYKQTNDDRNFGLRKYKVEHPSSGRRAAAPPKPPAGYILD